MEETYTPRTAQVSLLAQRRFHSDLRLGGTYDFWYEDVSETEDGGIIDSGEVQGSEGGISSGLGIRATWDTRDNIYYTKHGAFFDVGAVYHGGILGSDYDYSLFIFDFRYFLPLFGANSLGLRARLRASAGDTPFQAMPRIGGSNLLRGYPEGRYRDMTSSSLQAEFRSGYLWRLGFAVFGSLGNVAGRLGDLPDAPIRYTLGCGMRVRLNNENFNLRIDVGFGENTSGFYLVAGEAF
jgi:outer membrane protein assembly factor BamA